MPEYTKLPSLRVFSGMKGVQLAASICAIPNPIKKRLAATLISTIMLLNFAYSFMPTTSRVVIKTIINTAGKLIIEPVSCHPSAP